MKVEQGFYTKDLNVYLNRSENLGDTPVYTKEYFMQRFKYYNNSYKIFYAFDGEFTLTQLLRYSGIQSDNYFCLQGLQKHH